MAYQNPYAYNPYAYNNTFQQQQEMQRLQQLQAQQAQLQAMQQNQFQQAPPTMPQNSVIAVSSIEEVKAYATDWSGAINYFIDNANKKIYTKQVGNDGNVKINIYSLENNQAPNNSAEQTQQNQNNNDYVTRKEFQELQNRLKEYEKIILGSGRNESDANNAANDADENRSR